MWSASKWWECSECGNQIEGPRAPPVCSECGTAGVIFMPVDVDDPLAGKPESEGLRAAWLRTAFQQARSFPAATE